LYQPIVKDKVVRRTALSALKAYQLATRRIAKPSQAHRDIARHHGSVLRSIFNSVSGGKMQGFPSHKNRIPKRFEKSFIVEDLVSYINVFKPLLDLMS
jgi:hypothetical protein